MIIRSLRWRLGIAMALLIGAVVAVAGLFSSMTVKREFDRYLIAQRGRDLREAAAIMRRTVTLEEGMRDVHARLGLRSVAFDDARRVIALYPESMRAYRIVLHPDGLLELASDSEKLVFRGAGTRVVRKGTVYFLPPEEGDRPAPRAFRVSVNRALLAGLAAAALLATAVMLTIFRRVFAPVEALTRATRALAAGQLDARVDVRGGDEVADLGRAFNTMAEALERSDRARRNMVTDVAHELRTPLTSIRVQLEAAEDGVLAPDAKWRASIAEDAATLARLVDDLQELALADAGQMRLEREDIAVKDLVERAVAGLPLRGITLETDVPSELVVNADARRMVQVLRNLLVNAVTYAQSAIRLSAQSTTSGIEIRVADDGPGIADEHAERIFDRFYRADPSRSRATGGAGVGLAIAREIVELHGGTIRYEKPAFVIRLH